MPAEEKMKWNDHLIELVWFQGMRVFPFELLRSQNIQVISGKSHRKITFIIHHSSSSPSLSSSSCVFFVGEGFFLKRILSWVNFDLFSDEVKSAWKWKHADWWNKIHQKTQVQVQVQVQIRETLTRCRVWLIASQESLAADECQGDSFVNLTCVTKIDFWRRRKVAPSLISVVNNSNNIFFFLTTKFFFFNYLNQTT